MTARREPVRPEALTTEALHCAIAACERSRHASDREFAAACKHELAQRLPKRRMSPWQQLRRAA